MRVLSVVFLLLGSAILGWLIWREGAGDIFKAISLAGWSIFGIAAYRTIPLMLDAAGWMILLPRSVSPRPSLAVFTWARWITESLNTLLPVAQLGGHLVRAALIARRSVPAHLAGASVLVDFTMGFSAQIAFIILGAAYLTGLGLSGPELEIVAVSVLAGCAAVILMYLLQRSKAVSRISRRIPGMTRSRVMSAFVGGAERMEQGTRDIYARRKRIGVCGLLRFAGWMSKSGETWLILLTLGVGSSFAEAIALEAVSTFIMTAAFIIPGALGVREGGIVLAGEMIGIPPEQSLALALIKRIRELLVGVPGLAAWGWFESRAV
ncbi:MAG: flippase-like domain-containing protein, partial [Desulfovibrionales bacterium]